MKQSKQYERDRIAQAILISVAAALICGLLSGCVPIKTQIHVNPKTGDISYSSPKNVSIGSIVASVDSNGVHQVVVTDLKTLNDPAVIKSSGDANAQLATAIGTEVRGAASDTLAAFVTMGASQAIKPVQTVSTKP